MKKRGFDTKAIHGGYEGFRPDSMAVPLYQSVAYPFEDAQEAAAISAGVTRTSKSGWGALTRSR